MKIMIASDIHGSAFYCEKMIEAYRGEKADKLLLLGDILYHGPRNDLPKEYNPKKVIQMLNDIKEDILCVRGNCDTEVDQMVLEFPVLAEYCILYVKDRMIFATHGHTFNAEHLPMLKAGDILLNGHFHVPAYRTVGNIIYMNPGSVSIPIYEAVSLQLIMEDETFTWKNLEGDSYKKVSITTMEKE